VKARGTQHLAGILRCTLLAARNQPAEMRSSHPFRCSRLPPAVQRQPDQSNLNQECKNKEGHANAHYQKGMGERWYSIGNERQTGGEKKGRRSEECENSNRRKIHSNRHGDGDECCSYKKPTERKLQPVRVHHSSSPIGAHSSAASSSQATSAKSFGRPVARLFLSKCSRPITGTRIPLIGPSVR